MNKTWRTQTDTSKQPIRTRYFGHVTGYQPIRDQYFPIRSVPGQHHPQSPLTQSVANQQSQTTRPDGKLLPIPLSLSFYLSQPSRTLPDLATFSSNFSLSVNHMLPIVDGCGNNLSCIITIMPLDLHLSSSPIYLSLRRAGHHVRLALPPSITVGRALVR